MKGPMADMMKAMMGGQDMPDMEEMQSTSNAPDIFTVLTDLSQK